MSEFILPYEAVRTSASPAADIAAFIESTYDQAATLGPLGSRGARSTSPVAFLRA